MINPYGGEEDSIETVSWYWGDESVFLFLPANTDPDTARVYFSAGGEVLLDDETVISGESASGFTAGDHILSCGDQIYPLTVCMSENLPAVFLRTESGSLDYIHADKENREPGSIRIYENGSVTLDKDLKQIKGRGNYTWDLEKKPYNIKFDKKTDLFGMGKAKKWTLLANYVDFSLVHNAYAWEFASAFGLPYTSEYRHVDLYINGDYLGNYMICESVEIGENRVNITDLEKATEEANPGVELETLPQGRIGKNGENGSRKWAEVPQDPGDISGGYLLEYEYRDRYRYEPSGFVTQNGQPVVIKSPEYASQAEVTYIADFMDAGTEALYSSTGFNSAGLHYSDYFDVDSLAEMYILQELSMHCDAGFSSFFAYKPSGTEKVFFGPVWDMDNAFGSPLENFNIPSLEADLWYANQFGYGGIPTVLAAACRHADFREAVREKWTELAAGGVFEAVQEYIAQMSVRINASAEMNFLRWRHAFVFSHYPINIESWNDCMQISADFVAARIAFLSKAFAEDGAYLYYDLNGVSGGGWATVSPIRSIGESVEVCAAAGSKLTVPEGRMFYCWNTQPDESGRQYFPGDTLLLDSECTVLYAVWKTQSEIDALNDPNPFADVEDTSYYYEPVLWAVKNGITAGVSTTEFGSGRTCTRAQIVTFLFKAYA